MSANYPTDVKAARMQAVATKIDAGGSAGRLELLNAGGTILATVVLKYPAATISGVTLNLDTTGGLADTDADSSGDAVAARIRSSTGSDVVTGLTVGTSGADLNLDSITITAGQRVDIYAGAITHAG